MENQLTEQLQEYVSLLEKAIQEIEKFNSTGTKASSARVRKLSNQIGKDGRFLRKALLDFDKNR